MRQRRNVVLGMMIGLLSGCMETGSMEPEVDTTEQRDASSLVSEPDAGRDIPDLSDVGNVPTPDASPDARMDAPEDMLDMSADATRLSACDALSDLLTLGEELEPATGRVATRRPEGARLDFTFEASATHGVPQPVTCEPTTIGLVYRGRPANYTFVISRTPPEANGSFEVMGSNLVYEVGGGDAWAAQGPDCLGCQRDGVVALRCDRARFQGIRTGVTTQGEVLLYEAAVRCPLSQL